MPISGRCDKQNFGDCVLWQDMMADLLFQHNMQDKLTGVVNSISEGVGEGVGKGVGEGVGEEVHALDEFAPVTV